MTQLLLWPVVHLRHTTGAECLHGCTQYQNIRAIFEQKRSRHSDPIRLFTGILRRVIYVARGINHVPVQKCLYLVANTRDKNGVRFSITSYRKGRQRNRIPSLTVFPWKIKIPTKGQRSTLHWSICSCSRCLQAYLVNDQNFRLCG